ENSSVEVHIDVQGGSRVATLPSNPPAASGTVTWTQGTIVDPERTYLATVAAVVDGDTLATTAKRLRFDKIPLAITTRDRLLRIQFALPEQGLFTARKYSVKVFLAAQGQEFG